jgi:hypothetical protein
MAPVFGFMPSRRTLKALGAKMIGHNSGVCSTCNGEGAFHASQAEVCRDIETFHTTPEIVLEALRDSQTGFAVVTCPKCGGTGERQ